MKIGLINEDSQVEKNELIYNVLCDVVEPLEHKVYNFGMFQNKKHEINFTQIGILASILLKTDVVDFIITGCGTGQGAMISCNSFSNIVCGYVATPLDAYMFSQINAGNAISIPFAQNFGWGSEINLKQIFNTLFTNEFGGGYPKKFAEEESISRQRMFEEIKKPAQYEIFEAINRMDQEKIIKLLDYEVFKNIFSKEANQSNLTNYIKDLLKI